MIFRLVPIAKRIATEQCKTYQSQEIKKIQIVCKTIALIQYLESRKIRLEFAKEYLKEVYFSQNGKNYFGLCWKNDSGGYRG